MTEDSDQGLEAAAHEISEELARRRLDRSLLINKLKAADDAILRLDTAWRALQEVRADVPSGAAGGAVVPIRQSSGAAPAPEEADERTDLPRTDLVEQILRVAGQPLTRHQIVEEMHRLGRTSDSADDVSAALAYLAKKKRLAKGRGHTWEASRSATA